MKVPRVENLTKERFISDYLLPKKPVIVADAMDNWNMEKFNPAHLKKAFGDQYVQVYNDLFDLQTIEPLAIYLDRNFARPEDDSPDADYIRWYTQLKDIDFYWSDDVFSELKPYWQHPYFAPNSSLVLPFCEKNASKNVNEVSFPYKGLFISGKGSGTRLHKDPLNSNAILCQFYGEKQFVLFHPDKEVNVTQKGELVDLRNVDQTRFPHFNNITPDYEDVLKPGEAILFPAGWYHEVSCLSDSISVTWNFIHSLELEGLYKHLSNNPGDDQLEVLRFFLKGKISPDAAVNEIIGFYESNLIYV